MKFPYNFRLPLQLWISPSSTTQTPPLYPYNQTPLTQLVNLNNLFKHYPQLSDIDMEGDASSANNRKRKRTPDDSGEDQRGQTKKSKGGKTGEDTGKGKKLTFAQRLVRVEPLFLITSRKVLFEKTLSAYMNQNQAFEIVPRADFHTSLQEATAAISAQPFEKEEVESILTAMADEGKNVFYDEENIMFV